MLRPQRGFRIFIRLLLYSGKLQEFNGQAKIFAQNFAEIENKWAIQTLPEVTENIHTERYVNEFNLPKC